MRIHPNDCKILYVPRTREREREGNEEWVRLICAMLFLLLTYVIFVVNIVIEQHILFENEYIL